MCGEYLNTEIVKIDNECDKGFMCELNYPAYMFDKK